MVHGLKDTTNIKMSTATGEGAGAPISEKLTADR
jgi:hypothetical protein